MSDVALYGLHINQRPFMLPGTAGILKKDYGHPNIMLGRG